MQGGEMNVVYINGDGIGPEVMPWARRVLDRVTNNEIRWIKAHAGLDCYRDTGESLPKQTVDLIREHELAIKGPLTTPEGTGFRSANVALRQALDLYVGLRPAFGLGIQHLKPGMMIALFRENTEGLYRSTETISEDHETVTLTATFSRWAMIRLAKRAFQYARKHGFRRVTYVDKQNIHKQWGKLYHDAFLEVAAGFQEIPYDHRLVDATNMFLSLSPHTFGVIVTENMFGDILADHVAALMGGLGVAPGANIGNRVIVAEAVHGSWPQGAGKGIANPTALMLSGAMLLEHTGRYEAAQRIRSVIIRTIMAGNHTIDLGGTLSTEQFGEAVLSLL
jgi:isocitrate dehydrogenase (NAD+)